MAETRWSFNSDIHSNSLIRGQKVSICFSHYFIFNTARLEISLFWDQQ